MIAHVTQRQHFARSLVTVLLPIVLSAGASDAGATSLVAVHAPGGAVHVAIAPIDSETVTVSRSVGLMTGASGTAEQSSLGASPFVTRSVGLMQGAHR